MVLIGIEISRRKDSLVLFQIVLFHFETRPFTFLYSFTLFFFLFVFYFVFTRRVSFFFRNRNSKKVVRRLHRTTLLSFTPSVFLFLFSFPFFPSNLGIAFLYTPLNRGSYGGLASNFEQIEDYIHISNFKRIKVFHRRRRLL